MKKTTLVAFIFFLLQAAAFAQEKMLYDITDDMITLAETTISCAASDNTCTEADAIALKAAAENGLREIVELIKSGNLTGMKLTSNQILRLSSRLESLNSKYKHIGIFQTTCNLGLYIICEMALGYIFAGVYAILMKPIIGIVMVLLGLLAIPVGCLLLLTCLFWWI